MKICIFRRFALMILVSPFIAQAGAAETPPPASSAPAAPTAPAASAPAAGAALSNPSALGSVLLTLKIDKAEYMHGEPGVAYFMIPTGQLAATLTAKNTTSAGVALEFPSAQRFDFVLRDDKGAVVKRWSEGQMFGQMLGTLALKPGEEKVFAENVALGGPGKPLPNGSYTIEGTLTDLRPSLVGARGPVDVRVSARVPFKIIPTPAQ